MPGTLGEEPSQACDLGCGDAALSSAPHGPVLGSWEVLLPQASRVAPDSAPVLPHPSAPWRAGFLVKVPSDSSCSLPFLLVTIVADGSFVSHSEEDSESERTHFERGYRGKS